MFFQSLLPSFNVQGNPAIPAQPVPGGLQGQQQRVAEAARENEGTFISLQLKYVFLTFLI